MVIDKKTLEAEGKKIIWQTSKNVFYKIKEKYYITDGVNDVEVEKEFVATNMTIVRLVATSGMVSSLVANVGAEVLKEIGDL